MIDLLTIGLILTIQLRSVLPFPFRFVISCFQKIKCEGIHTVDNVQIKKLYGSDTTHLDIA